MLYEECLRHSYLADGTFRPFGGDIQTCRGEKKLRHLGRKGVIERMDFTEV